MNRRILVVEDRELNAKLLRDVLLAKDYEVEVCATAEEGLVTAGDWLPALILMDIQLPGMDGVAALRELKKNPATASIPTIAVTASVMPMEREEILDAGFDGYIPKPVKIKELLADVRMFVDGEGG